MNKKIESALFIAVAVAVICSLRFTLSHMERTAHEYEYAGSLNLEEQKTQVAEKTQEDADKDENLDDTDPEDSQEEQGDEAHDDLREDTDDETADNGSSQKTSDDSGAGNGNGLGDGDGAGSGTPGPASATPMPTQSPQATQAPESPTEKPDNTNQSEDTVTSIQVSWPTKDEIFYDEDLKERKKKIVVTAVYASGEESVLDAGDYQIRGLSSTSKGCGQHTMTVSYGDLECQLEYTVNDWIKGIYLDWDTDGKNENGMRLYKGEMIWDEVVYVWAKMASSGNGDENDVDLDYGEYNVQGLDTNKTGESQNFTVTYEGYSVSGTCQFHERVKTTHTIYCNDTAHTDIVSEETETEVMEVKSGVNKKLSSLGTVTKEKDGKYYTLSEQLIVDGTSRDLPYTLKYDNRELNIELYHYYVYDPSQNIASITYEWKGNATKDGILDSEASFASQIRIIAVMEDGEEQELNYSACEVTEPDAEQTGKKQEFTIRYRDWTVTGTCEYP